jgi:hypothetical protein
MKTKPYLEISSHKKALRLALRTVQDKWQELSELYATGEWQNWANSKERAEQILQNYSDTECILDNLIEEED